MKLLTEATFEEICSELRARFPEWMLIKPDKDNFQLNTAAAAPQIPLGQYRLINTTGTNRL